MTTVALNNLLTYIQSLNLSKRNRKWLAEKIVEPQQIAIEKQSDGCKDTIIIKDVWTLPEEFEALCGSVSEEKIERARSKDPMLDAIMEKNSLLDEAKILE